MVCLDVSSTGVLRLLDALVSDLRSSREQQPQTEEKGGGTQRQPSMACLKEKRHSLSSS